MGTLQRRYDTYGFAAAELEDVAGAVESFLGLHLEERESGFFGGVYRLYRPAYGRELRLFRNHDPVHDVWVRDQYRGYALILEVSNLENMDQIQARLLQNLSGAVLLDSRTLHRDDPLRD